MEDLMSVLHRSLSFYTRTQIYIRFTRFSLSLLQSNLTRKIKANIQAVLSRGIPLISRHESASARAATAYFDCLLQKSSSSSSSSSSNTDGSSRRLAKNYNHNLKKKRKVFALVWKKTFLRARARLWLAFWEGFPRARLAVKSFKTCYIFVLLFVFSIHSSFCFI